MSDQTPDTASGQSAPPPFDKSLIGRYVEAVSARRRRPGVILPPVGRSLRPRLACDDGQLVPLDPAWRIEDHPSLLRDREQRVLSTSGRFGGRPTYRRDDLPAHLLATATMLRTEHRKQPRPGQPVIAWYRLFKDWAPLYAIADAAPLPALSEKRAAAWAASRTCSRCGSEHARPLPLSPPPDSRRCCTPCRQLMAGERWIAQSRVVQAEMAAWASDVLTDPSTVLAASWNPRGWGAPHFYVETVGGRVLLDAHVRSATDDEIASFQPDARPKYEGSVFVGELLETIRQLSERRIVTWYGGELSELPHGLWKVTGDVLRTHTAPENRVVERYRLWTGESPGGLYEWWYPEPKLPWIWTGTGEHERGYKTAQTAKARVHWLREYLGRMAEQEPPEPTVRGGNRQPQ